MSASLAFYETLEAYRQMLSAVPDAIRPLAHEEYEAWYDLNLARFDFWNDVSFTQTWYSAKPMDTEGYFENLLKSRRAEIGIERAIILDGMPYQQQGTTVTRQQWEEWIAEHSVPEDMERVPDYYMPEDSVVSARVNRLKATFQRWIAARHAIVAALPKEQGISYDNFTADIHWNFVKRKEKEE